MYAASRLRATCGAGLCTQALSLGGTLVQLARCPDTVAVGCFCGFPCAAPADCPAALSGGTATAACAMNVCYMSCTNSMTCPAGMGCVESLFVPRYPFACAYQQKVDGPGPSYRDRQDGARQSRLRSWQLRPLGWRSSAAAGASASRAGARARYVLHSARTGACLNGVQKRRRDLAYTNRRRAIGV